MVAEAMTWSDPDCDVALLRAQTLSLLEQGHAVHCVWSGKRLTAERLDVGHCLLWFAWPCGNLWKLLPASWRVNQHGKHDCLPSANALRAARNAVLPNHFATECGGCAADRVGWRRDRHLEQSAGGCMAFVSPSQEPWQWLKIHTSAPSTPTWRSADLKHSA